MEAGINIPFHPLFTGTGDTLRLIALILYGMCTCLGSISSFNIRFWNSRLFHPLDYYDMTYFKRVSMNRDNIISGTEQQMNIPEGVATIIRGCVVVAQYSLLQHELCTNRYVSPLLKFSPLDCIFWHKKNTCILQYLITNVLIYRLLFFILYWFKTNVNKWFTISGNYVNLCIVSIWMRFRYHHKRVCLSMFKKYINVIIICLIKQRWRVC